MNRKSNKHLSKHVVPGKKIPECFYSIFRLIIIFLFLGYWYPYSCSNNRLKMAGAISWEFRSEIYNVLKISLATAALLFSGSSSINFFKNSLALALSFNPR